MAEDCFFNLSSGTPVNDQWEDNILKFATERLMVNGKKKFREALPKTKFAAFKVTAKFTKVEKNNKQCTIEVNRYVKLACQSFC